MARKRRLLVRHPGPNPTESLVGYLLRLTESNGYPNTHYMLADSGMYRKGDSIRIQLLAAITNRTTRDLRSIAWHSQDKKTGLVLGQPVSKMEIDTCLAPVCPPCVNEKGFMEAHFSLSLMTICPEHRVLLAVCPGCARPLTWKRAGPLRCDCGQSLIHSMELRVPTAVVELLDIVRRKVLSLSAATESASGLPVRALGAMSLRSLLFLIRSLGRRSAGEWGKSKLSMEKARIVEEAAKVLSDWPNNFRKMLDAMTGPASSGGPCKLSKGELSGFYISIMFGIRRRDESAFMRDELVKYAVERFGKGTDDRTEKARIIGDRQQYFTRSEMAARLGVDRRSANRILSEGSVETIRVESANGRSRVLIDLSSIPVPPSPNGKILNADEAAAAIGFPRKVLTLLKETSLFKPRYLPPGIRGFHELDIEEYRTRLLNPLTEVPAPGKKEKLLTLGQLLAGSKADMMTKAVVISEIHAGRLPVSAKNAKTVQDILIAQDVLRSLTQTRSLPDWRALRGSSWNVSNDYGGISMGQAAREIGCSQATVCALRTKEILRRSSGNGCAKWVNAESVDTFRSRFESLSSFARALRTNSSALRRVCDELRIALLDIDQENGNHQLFIRRQDISKLLSGRQFAKSVGRHTRLRWKRLAETHAINGNKRKLERNKSGATSARARQEFAA